MASNAVLAFITSRGRHTIARILAENNFAVVIIEKRNHIAGNCYDEINKKGLRIHKYGPHYMRFKKRKVFNYVSKFTKWIKGNYIVKSSINFVLLIGKPSKILDS